MLAKGKAIAIARGKKQGMLAQAKHQKNKSKLENFRRENQAQQEKNLINKQKELASYQLAVEVRKGLHVSSTRDQYDRYHQKFMVSNVPAQRH